MDEQKKRFGEILIEKGIITQAQLDEAMRGQQILHGPKKIGNILKRLGYISDPQIYEALSEQRYGANSSMPHAPFVKVPEFESPTVTITIESVNGCSGIAYCSMGGVNLYRQPDESDEDLAKRAGQEIEAEVLRALQENPKTDWSKYHVKEDLDKSLDQLAESLAFLNDKETETPTNTPPTELPDVNFGELMADCSPEAIENRRSGIYPNGDLSGDPKEFFPTRDIGEMLDEFSGNIDDKKTRNPAS